MQTPAADTVESIAPELLGVRADSPEQLRPLVQRIRSSGAVKPVFIIGPPRTGTTLLGQLLGHGDNVLSLSEPFLVWRIMRPFVARSFFGIMSFRMNWRVPIPPSLPPHELFTFVRDAAERTGKNRLVIKEAYHDFGLPSPWINIDLVQDISASGAPLVLIIRNPYDAISSTLNLARKYALGWRGYLLKIFAIYVPRFASEDEIVGYAAHNWAQFARWAAARREIVVRYEDLVTNPGVHLRRVCEQLGLPFEESMLTENRRPGAFGGLGDPSVLTGKPKPIHASSIGRGKGLSTSQSSIVTSHCGQIAGQFGYQARN